MTRGQRVLGGIAATTALLAAGFVVGRVSSPGSGAPSRPTGSSDARPGPTGSEPGVGGTEPALPVEPTQATLDVRARSAQTDTASPPRARVTLLGDVALEGFQLNVVDARGRTHTSGFLKIHGSRVTITGAGAVVKGGITMRPGGEVLLLNAVKKGGAVPTITVMRAKVAAASFFMDDDEIPGPVTISSVFSSEPADLRLQTPSVRWRDAPRSIKLEALDDAALVSWRGGGALTVGARRFRSTHLGIMATSITGTIASTANGVTVKGAATVRQVFVEGRPALRTTARVDIVLRPPSVARGETGQFVWAPRNTGSDFEMAMMRIRPASAAGKWIQIAVAPMPSMFGGDPGARVGGQPNADELQSCFFFCSGPTALRSLIDPGTADRREITFDVPPNTSRGVHQMKLVVEGNFKPITVVVRVRVT